MDNIIGRRKFFMHMLATASNLIIAISIVFGAVMTNNGDALMALVVNGLAQPMITGSGMWANAKEHETEKR